MARAATVMAETDDGEYVGAADTVQPGAGRPALPDGIGNAYLSDLPRGTDSRPAGRPLPEPDYQIVDEPPQPEVAAEPEPTHRRSARRDDEQTIPADASLAETADDGTFLGRRRETPAQRRERQRQSRERNQNENARLNAEVHELRQRLEGIEPRLSQFDQARVQQQAADFQRQIQEAERAEEHASGRISEAMIAQDGPNLQKALRDRDNAIMARNQLQVRRNMLLTGNPFGDTTDPAAARATQPAATTQPARTTPQPMTREVRERVEDFVEAHPWFKPVQQADGSTGGDLDTQMALHIDHSVAAEGFQPNTQDYWDEVEDRMRRYLPHRFEQQNGRATGAANGRQPAAQPAQPRQVAPQQRGPRVAGGGESAPRQNGANQIYLTPERKQALILSGALDRDGKTINDRAKFGRTVKYYQDYDRANGVAQQ
jgi:hypothetical protein